MLTDHHCHLDFAVFDDDRDNVVARARAAGVSHCVLASTTRSRWTVVGNVARRYGFSYQLGLHPCFMGMHRLSGIDNDIDALVKALDNARHDSLFAGIGECGVDKRFVDTLPLQWTLLEAQLALANARKLPVTLHCVRLYDEVASMLRRRPPATGSIVHAFTGSLQQAKRFVDLGVRIGIGGAITQPRNARLREVVRTLPLNAIALESDAPDMPPYWTEGDRPSWVHRQGTRDRNEPALVGRLAALVTTLHDRD